MLTIDDLWQEYREECCPGEGGEELHWQKMAFFAGITATLGNIIDRPSGFKELKDSLIQWVENQEAEKN